MRLPSDAQARLLACIAEWEHQGIAVEWDAAGRPWQPSAAQLWVEQTDGENSRFVYADGNHREHRMVTVCACLRHGWLSGLHTRTIQTTSTWELTQLDTTEDGVIALGLWRERRAAAPPAPLPVLVGNDREVVALAEQADRLGYRMVPVEDVARRQARRLRREGWVTRGYVPKGGRSVKPTAMGIVEVAPSRADGVPA